MQRQIEVAADDKGHYRDAARAGRLHVGFHRVRRLEQDNQLGVNLAGAQTIEKKLVASLKRLEGETLVRQLARARAAVYPAAQPQERVLTLPSFLIRYGPGLVDALEQEVARWAGAS